jgi:hypothetical protein
MEAAVDVEYSARHLAQPSPSNLYWMLNDNFRDIFGAQVAFMFCA